MLRRHRDDDRRVLAPLRLVPGHHVGQRDPVELVSGVKDRPAVELDGDVAELRWIARTKPISPSQTSLS